MKKHSLWFIGTIMFVIITLFLFSCEKKDDTIKIGVSFGVGKAIRWEQEKIHMENRAKELGVEIQVRLNKTDEPKTQEEDCIELIDSGIDVLIFTPRDITKVHRILSYAKEHKVPVLNYTRMVIGEPVDLFIGYDCGRIGQRMGQYITEMVYTGDYILLRGDESDNNATLLYDGAMRYIDPIKNDINILLDTSIPGWDPATAKAVVKEAVANNNNHVDAILAPNDKLAGACAEALAELGVTDEVIITGMDAELAAIRRIAAGTQSSTFLIDLKLLSFLAIDEACHIANGEKVLVNADLDNKSRNTIDSNLISGQLITKDNLDRVLIEGGYYTYRDIYR